MRPRKCPYGGRIAWSEPWRPSPGIVFVRLVCLKSSCDYSDLDCGSEYFENTEKGREAAIIDWNRKNCKRAKKNARRD